MENDGLYRKGFLPQRATFFEFSLRYSTVQATIFTSIVMNIALDKVVMAGMEVSRRHADSRRRREGLARDDA